MTWMPFNQAPEWKWLVPKLIAEYGPQATNVILMMMMSVIL